MSVPALNRQRGEVMTSNSPVTGEEPEETTETTELVELERESPQVVEAQRVEMRQSAAFSVLADEVDVHESAVGIIRAEQVRVRDSATLLLAAGEVHGDVTTVFTPATAAIIGAAMIIGIWMIRPRR